MKSSPIAATTSAIPVPAGDAEMLTGRQLRTIAELGDDDRALPPAVQKTLDLSADVLAVHATQFLSRGVADTPGIEPVHTGQGGLYRRGRIAQDGVGPPQHDPGN